MKKENKKERRRSGITKLFIKVLTLVTVCWVALLSITLVLTLCISLNTSQSEIESGLKSTATSLARSPMVVQALKNGYCPPELVSYLDSVVSVTEDLDIITIANTDSTRIYHVMPDRIGLKFVGGDQNKVLEGRSYFSDAVGSMGLQHRYFTPVLEGDDNIIGFVMTSATMDSLEQIWKDVTRFYVNLAIFLAFASLLLSGVLSLFIKKMLLGFDPEELVHSYLTQNEMLNNLNEGIISVDYKGDIQLVNRAAEEMLGQNSELLENSQLDGVITGSSGESLLPNRKMTVQTSRPNILARCIPLEKNGVLKSTTLILSDRTEAMRTAEQLVGTRHIISSLRANNHEFMNKLQVISGLLQMDRSQDALNYIGAVSALHAKTIAPILQHIHNPNVAALMLGKLDNMKELDIKLTLLVNSYLPERSRYLSAGDLVKVVGNLLENAIEAINARSDNGDRDIVMQLTENDEGLLIVVSDTGVGISPENLERIYEQGFSTKASEGRGTGMTLIKEVVTRCEGNIEVESEPGSGTTFTLIFDKERKRK